MPWLYDYFMTLTTVAGLVIMLYVVAVLTVPWYGRRSATAIWPGQYREWKVQMLALADAVLLFSYGWVFATRVDERLDELEICLGDSQLTSIVGSLLPFILIMIGSAITPRLLKYRTEKPQVSFWDRLLVIVIVVVIIGPTAWYFLSTAKYRQQPRIDQVQMMSGNTGWVLGRTTKGISWLWRYDAGRWQAEAVPGSQPIKQMDMVGPDEGWLLRWNETSHYRAGTWQSAPLPSEEFSSFDMLDGSTGWAVGSNGLLAQYIDERWTQVTSPTTGTLQSVAVVGPNEAWAVGGEEFSSTPARLRSIILHYKAGQWSVVPSPTTLPLLSIAMVSANEGWAVGGSARDAGRSVILHYQRGVWQEVSAPTQVALKQVSMLSADEGWAVGGDYYRVSTACQDDTRSERLNVVLHYQAGTWQVVESPHDDFIDVVTSGAPGTAWVISSEALFQYDGKAWARPLLAN